METAQAWIDMLKLGGVYAFLAVSLLANWIMYRDNREINKWARDFTKKRRDAE